MQNNEQILVSEQTANYVIVVKEFDNVIEKFNNLVSKHYGEKSETANETSKEMYEKLLPARDLMLNFILFSVDENIGKLNCNMI